MPMISDIVVVCVGNICRSPMGAALLKDRLGADSDVKVSSAGVGALVGFPADEFAVELMREQGIDIAGHRARQLNQDIIKASDLILVMESGHKAAIDSIDPTARGKVYRIGEWRDLEIDDPFRQPKEAFAAALGLIEQGVDDWVGRIKA
jgi:protein-tyrosine phosphatase